jgi:hypothetical protein
MIYYQTSLIHQDHVERHAMVDETAKRLPPVRCRCRGFLVQDDLKRLFVHFRDPLVAMPFPETLQDRSTHLL